jgi:hypothetical protein
MYPASSIHKGDVTSKRMTCSYLEIHAYGIRYDIHMDVHNDDVMSKTKSCICFDMCASLRYQALHADTQYG